MPTIKKLMLNGIEYKWGKSPAPTLLSYEEIVAMNGPDVYTELNKYPSEYYNKFLFEGRLIYGETEAGDNYAIANNSGDNKQRWEWSGDQVYFYYTASGTWLYSV